MLARYFGFDENPFGATPDPRFLYASRTHAEALASLRYAYSSNRGFTAMIAPPGMGKTTLLFEFLNRIRGTARSALIFNSLLGPLELLKAVVRETGLAPRESLGQLLEQLNAEVIQTARSGQHFVVIVDEAQNLTPEALEMLRMLTNFETPRAKLMQIVLSGQPQLSTTLLNPCLVQLRQRISTFCKLVPLSRDETADYIARRLTIAGYRGSELFSSEALELIGRASEGIPRNINTMCFNALTLCCALKKRKVDLPILEEAIADLELSRPAAREQEGEKQQLSFKSLEVLERRRRPMSLTRALGVGVAILLLVALFLLSRMDRPFSAKVIEAPSTILPSQPAATNFAKLRPGDEPIAITVDSEQTLSAISVSELGSYDDQLLREIRDLNPELIDPNLIHPGQRILLPRRALNVKPRLSKQTNSGNGQ